MSHIRENPEFYTASGSPSGVEIATNIGSDALILGANSVLTTRYHDWWIVGADLDWLRSPCKCNATPIEFFQRLIGFPELAVNSHRHEVVATAFADVVVSASGADRIIAKGEVSADDKVWNAMLASGMIRSVAFRLGTALRNFETGT